MIDLSVYLDAAKQAALRAADVLESWRPRFKVKEKGRFDLVTEADLASQQTIQTYLSGRFPDHAFLGEEEGASKIRPAVGAPPTWIIDPIDGTTNYVHDSQAARIECSSVRPSLVRTLSMRSSEASAARRARSSAGLAMAWVASK